MPKRFGKNLSAPILTFAALSLLVLDACGCGCGSAPPLSPSPPTPLAMLPGDPPTFTGTLLQETPGTPSPGPQSPSLLWYMEQISVQDTLAAKQWQVAIYAYTGIFNLNGGTASQASPDELYTNAGKTVEVWLSNPASSNSGFVAAKAIALIDASPLPPASPRPSFSPAPAGTVSCDSPEGSCPSSNPLATPQAAASPQS